MCLQEGDEVGYHTNMQHRHNPSLICNTDQAHVMLQHRHMMDLTLTETRGPVDYLSASLTQINPHQIECVSK